MMESEPSSPFIVVEAKLAFQLAVVELDRPAQAGEAGEALAGRGGGKVREPVVGR